MLQGNFGQPPPKKTGISMPSSLALADCLGNTYQGLQPPSTSAVSPATPCGHVFMGQSCIQPASHGKSCPHGCCHSWKHLCKRVLEAWTALASPAAHSQPGLEAPQTSGSTSETQCSPTPSYQQWTDLSTRAKQNKTSCIIVSVPLPIFPEGEIITLHIFAPHSFLRAKADLGLIFGGFFSYHHFHRERTRSAQNHSREN